MLHVPEDRHILGQRQQQGELVGGDERPLVEDPLDVGQEPDLGFG
jgi:hypothetical protein